MNPKLVKFYALVCMIIVSIPCSARSQTGDGIVIQSYAEPDSLDFAHQKAFASRVNVAFANDWVVDILADEELVSAPETLEAVNLSVIDGLFSQVKNLSDAGVADGLADKYSDWRSDSEFIDFMASERVKAWLESAFSRKKLMPLGVYVCEQYVMLAKVPIHQVGDFQGKSVFTTSKSLKKALLANSAKTVMVVSNKVAKELLKKGRVSQDIVAIKLQRALGDKVYKHYPYLLPRAIAPQSVCMFGLSQKSWAQLSLAQQQRLLDEFQSFKQSYHFMRQIQDDRNWRVLMLNDAVLKMTWSDRARTSFIASLQKRDARVSVSGLPAIIQAYKNEIGELP